MSANGPGTSRAVVFRVALVQLVLVLIITMVLFVFGSQMAMSAIYAGIVVMLPNMLMGLFWSRKSLRHQTQFRDIVIGELGKWLMMVLLMTALFVLTVIEPLAFFGTIVALLPAPVVAQIWRPGEAVIGT